MQHLGRTIVEHQNFEIHSIIVFKSINLPANERDFTLQVLNLAFISCKSGSQFAKGSFFGERGILGSE